MTIVITGKNSKILAVIAKNNARPPARGITPLWVCAGCQRRAGPSTKLQAVASRMTIGVIAQATRLVTNKGTIIFIYLVYVTKKRIFISVTEARKLASREVRNRTWVKMRYSAVTYVAITKLSPYQSRLPVGSISNHRGCASWSCPQGREYHNGTSGGKNLVRHKKKSSDTKVKRKTPRVERAMRRFVCSDRQCLVTVRKKIDRGFIFVPLFRRRSQMFRP